MINLRFIRRRLSAVRVEAREPEAREPEADGGNRQFAVIAAGEVDVIAVNAAEMQQINENDTVDNNPMQAEIANSFRRRILQLCWRIIATIPSVMGMFGGSYAFYQLFLKEKDRPYIIRK